MAIVKTCGQVEKTKAMVFTRIEAKVKLPLLVL